MPANSKEQVLALINQANNRSFTLDHLSFGLPQPNTGPIERNTALIVTSLYTSTFVGPVSVYYNRIDLGVMFSAINMSFDYSVEYETTHDLLPLIYNQFNIALEPNDVVNEALNLPATFPKQQIVRANPFSFDYCGEMTLDLRQPPVADVLFTYTMINNASDSPNYKDLTVGYGKINVNDGSYQILGKALIGLDTTSTVQFSTTVVAADQERIYVATGGSASNSTGALHVFNYDEASITPALTYKRISATHNTAYKTVAVDPISNIVWVMEIQTTKVSPFTTIKKLMALRWNTTTVTFDILGEYGLVTNDPSQLTIHNGYAIVYARNANVLQAFVLNEGVVNLVATSAPMAPSGMDLTSNYGGSPITSDNTYIHLFAGWSGSPSRMYTFDGATFTEVWQLSHFPGTTSGGVAGTDVILTKNQDPNDDSKTYVHLSSFDGITSVLKSSTMRGSQYMGMAYEPVHRLVLLPTHGGLNIYTGSPNTLSSGVYQIDANYEVVKIIDQFLVEEATPHTTIDGLGQIFILPS